MPTHSQQSISGRSLASVGRIALLLATVTVVAGAAHAQTIAITGGRVFPVSGPVIENGTVIIRDGRIVAVGANLPVPAGAQRVDATGKWVTPGIFDAVTHLGVTEISMAASTNDYSAHGSGDGITPSFRVWEGYNPDSPLLVVTRDEGITTVGVVPSGGLIAGQVGVVQLRDGSLDDALLEGPAAVFADIDGGGGRQHESRGEAYQRLRAVLTDARDYPSHRSEIESGRSRPLAAGVADLQALQPVLSRQLALVVAADRASDIEMVLKIAREFNIRVAIAGAAEAWKVADKIAAAKAYIVTGAFNNIPRSFSELGARQENAGLLQRAGVPVVLAEMNLNPPTDPGSFNVRNIRYEAGLAVAFGLSWDAALRAVTLAPAEMYSVSDQVGSLQPGKDATLVVWSGDPFELYTYAERVYVHGKEVQRPSRQDELMRRYRTLPPDYRH